MTLLTTAFAQGTHAARPAAAAANQGYYYFETDTQKLFQSTGSAWTQIASVGGATDPLTTKGDLWGYGSADARIPVGSDGQVLTADSAQTLGLKWATPAAGGLVKLYETTLGVAAASIDTGVGGIASGHGDLICSLIGRSSGTSTWDNVALQFNSDTGANYDVVWTRDNTGTVGDVHTIGGTSIGIAQVPGSSGTTANAPGEVTLRIPAYDKTTFFKVGDFSAGTFANGASAFEAIVGSFMWHNTAAISQMKLTLSSGGNFVAGTRFVIYAAQ